MLPGLILVWSGWLPLRGTREFTSNLVASITLTNQKRFFNLNFSIIIDVYFYVVAGQVLAILDEGLADSNFDLSTGSGISITWEWQ